MAADNEGKITSDGQKSFLAFIENGLEMFDHAAKRTSVTLRLKKSRTVCVKNQLFIKNKTRHASKLKDYAPHQEIKGRFLLSTDFSMAANIADEKRLVFLQRKYFSVGVKHHSLFPGPVQPPTRCCY